MEPLHIKHRPTNLADVRGQPTIKGLPSVLEEGKFHSFLFYGNSGTGKTTVARIIGNILNIIDVIEVDAATYTGVDDMRELASGLQYRSMRGASGKKLLILDECHMLSKSAWNSLLKLLEEPPPHLYIVLCTTEISKVPNTIQTRCAKYKLSDLEAKDLKELVSRTAEIEGILISEEIINTIVEFSFGSARQALVLLAQCRDVETVDDFLTAYRQTEGTLDSIDLCKAIIKKRDQAVISAILKDLKDKNLYGVKIDITNYLTGCVLRANNMQEAQRFLSLLECFDRPIEQATGFSTLVLCVYEARLK